MRSPGSIPANSRRNHRQIKNSPYPLLRSVSDCGNREMGINIGGQIERVSGKELSYREFVERYMKKNEPVVITGLMDDWRACRDWVSEGGKPNLHFFSTHFGKSRVQVADCGTREFTDQKRVEMSVSQFVDQWLHCHGEDHADVSTSERNSILYLKDWHFVKEYPVYTAYTTPLFFHDDWLNLYLDYHHMHKDPDTYQETNEICCSDYRFVYMGAKGSWTPLHADVFRSYSWSANVCGKKQWLFLPPSQHHLVFDRNMKNSVYDIFNDAVWLECTQERNEIIFVPSGWYHQVHNLEDTISINHNWFNSYNLSWIWDLLQRDYNEAKDYIEDIRDICDDFEGLCQRNLAANTGMNFNDFFTFITRFTFANLVLLDYLCKDNEDVTGMPSSPIVSHLISNLASLRKVALSMESTEGLSDNPGIVHLAEMSNDPKFLELCSALGKTYKIIHGSDPQSYGAWRDNLGNSDLIKILSKVCTPRDLVNGMDCAVKELRSFSSLSS
ncbi:2-oxoglutarate and iron-dependent oxygenase JMJD4 isoform X2 [Punica granatum]|uniref:2-oxoglutarate and iron-dependent oxygenase JMJD4 isoform X2 n=1 Tax=Punica granatum TaxID=22663 RepID=A0A6P8EP45_PUNGR|nr:2-oxoglutarate and iron-dependent oxygenase JMJD4 isoform X2 [Punica granatum]